jgi:3-deoxy-D-manno-octulosonic acid (KDO) 8-phosphate synthase
MAIRRREFVEHLAYEALAAGENRLFFEVNTDPDRAIYSRANQIDAQYVGEVGENSSGFWRLWKGVEPL